MASKHPTEMDSGAADSVSSTPRSEQHRLYDDSITLGVPLVRFMCSFGGKILPRPHDNQLRYVGGDTRILALPRHATFSLLLAKLAKLSGATNIIVKYQLPNEDLDALITVACDDDVENMMEEYDRLAQNQKTARLRLFLFDKDADSRTSSVSSLLDGSAKRARWFLDALNGGPSPGSVSGLERGRSEASSIISEVPDYLFGLDNSDDPPRDSKLSNRILLSENVPSSDPGSPSQVVTSPFCSASSTLAPPFLPDLPPVKTKPNNPVPAVEPNQSPRIERMTEIGDPTNIPSQTGYAINPNSMWQYVPDSTYAAPPMQQVPVYYVPAHIQSGNLPMPIRAPYVQSFPVYHHAVPSVGQVYGAGLRQVVAVDPYDISAKIVVTEGVNQPGFCGVKNAGMVSPYAGMMVPGGEEVQGTGADGNLGRVSHST